MNNNRNRLSDAQIQNVSGGAYIDFERIRRMSEAINAGNENAALGWHWGDDWGEDSYWH